MRTSKQNRPAELNRSIFNKQNRTVWDVQHERDAGYGTLKRYGGAGGTVEMFWDLNDAAIRDQIFKLRAKGTCPDCKNRHDIEILLDWEEITKYGRWV